MAYVLKEKLKGLKVCIKEWNSKTYAMIDHKIVSPLLISEVKILLGFRMKTCCCAKTCSRKCGILELVKLRFLLRELGSNGCGREMPTLASFMLQLRLKVRGILFVLSVSVTIGWNLRWKFGMQRWIISSVYAALPIGKGLILMVYSFQLCQRRKILALPAPLA
jgi:hypothetical protein